MKIDGDFVIYADGGRRSMEAHKRKNVRRMFVAGEYIPSSHSLHQPGRYTSWGEVTVAVNVSPPYVDPVKERIKAELREEYAEADRKHATREEGYVYVISNPAWPDWVKVGRSALADRRCDQMQTSDPFRAYTLHMEKYFVKVAEAEKELHNRLARIGYRQRNEWFEMLITNATDLLSKMYEEKDHE